LADSNSNTPTLRTSIGVGPAPAAPSTPINAVVPKQRRGYAITWQYVHRTGVAGVPGGVPVQMPAMRVPEGATVRVRASTTVGTNANPIHAALDYFVCKNTAIGGAGGTTLQPGDDIEFAVGNVAEIWIQCVNGDGAVLGINRQRGHLGDVGGGQQDRHGGRFT
jgi:hypothetical protein